MHVFFHKTNEKHMAATLKLCEEKRQGLELSMEPSVRSAVQEIHDEQTRDLTLTEISTPKTAFGTCITHLITTIHKQGSSIQNVSDTVI